MCNRTLRSQDAAVGNPEKHTRGLDMCSLPDLSTGVGEGDRWSAHPLRVWSGWEQHPSAGWHLRGPP